MRRRGYDWPWAMQHPLYENEQYRRHMVNGYRSNDHAIKVLTQIINEITLLLPSGTISTPRPHGVISPLLLILEVFEFLYMQKLFMTKYLRINFYINLFSTHFLYFHFRTPVYIESRTK